MPVNNPQYVTAATADLLWPYISDTGTKPPESCIFGQFLNIGAFLLCVIFYIRYKQVAEFYAIYPHEKKRLKKLNTFSMGLGIFGSLGVSMVGNFQETSMYKVHVIGASMCFGLGTVYLWVQVYLTRFIAPPDYPCLIKIFRIILALIDTIALLVAGSAGAVASYLADLYGDNVSYDHCDVTFNKDSKAWPFHLASTISEWILAISFMVFLLTLWVDFSYLTLSVSCNRQQ